MFRHTDILPDNTYTMLIMVAKHVHGWIIFQCPMFCPSLLFTATPSGMLLVQITVLLQLPTANDANHRETKKQAHKLEI